MSIDLVFIFYSFLSTATHKKKPKPVVQVNDEHIKGEPTKLMGQY